MDSDNPLQTEETAVPGPGERLRDARLRNGLEVKWVATQLHIKEWMIEAMEANQFDRITPPVFVKGYLSNYARFIGEPVDEIMALYRNCCGVEEVVVKKAVTAQPQDFTTVDAGHPGMKAATMGIVAIVLVLFGIWGATQVISSVDMDVDGMMAKVTDAIPFLGKAEDEQMLVPPVPDEIKSGAVAENEPEKLVMEPEPAIEETAAPNEDEQLSSHLPDPRELSAALSAGSNDNEAVAPPVAQESAVKEKEIFVELIATSWVDVKDSSGEFKLLGEMKEGQRHKLGGTPPYTILFGRAEAVKLVVDGQSYDFSAHKKGTVARFTYNPQ